MINLLICIIVGVVLGWIASLVMRTNGRQGFLADIIVGIVGASVSGYLPKLAMLLMPFAAPRT